MCDCNRLIDQVKVKVLSQYIQRNVKQCLLVKMINPINSLMIDNVEVKPKTIVALSGLVNYNKLFLKQHGLK